MQQRHTHHDEEYLHLLGRLLNQHRYKDDRTGTGTISLFGERLRFSLRDAFPLLTTKRVYWKGVAHELLWFLRGDTNIKYLNDNGVHIWDEWADEDGELGPVYGAQWRNWLPGKTDQLAGVIEKIKNDPDDRRLIVSAWNVAAVPLMALPPCHVLFQFYVRDGELSCQVYQRSCDVFLGVPFNIASYALLTHMVAHFTGLKVGDLIWIGGDTHIYMNHIEQVREQLSRASPYSPTLTITGDIPKDIAYYTFDQLNLQNYAPHPAIKAAVSV